MYGKLVPPEELVRQGQFKVALTSVGNPDHGQDPDRTLYGVPNETIAVNTMQEASEACRKYISEHMLGGGNWSGGQIVENGTYIAVVSYNGRVWYPEDK
jgi:hypothetical protein